MKFNNSEVEAVFNTYNTGLREKLLGLRQLIFATAAETKGVGSLEETLKWGQPSYLTRAPKSGSTIRIDAIKSMSGQYAMYFHCQTTLVETFREVYPDELTYEGCRAIVFNVNEIVAEKPLRHCIALALTYHLNKIKK